MAPPLTIAELVTEGIEPAVALWRDCGLTRPWNDPHADAGLALASPASTILAGWEDDRLVATAMVGFDGHRAWIYYLAVAPGLQRLGHGRRMVEACEAWAKARGAPKIMLMVRTGNAAADRFYAAIGYVEDAVKVVGRRFA